MNNHTCTGDCPGTHNCIHYSVKRPTKTKTVLTSDFAMNNKDTPQSNGFSKSSPMPDSYSSGYTPQSNTDWREKLKKICDYSGIGMCPGCGLTPEALDTLISQLLEAEKKRWREEVEGMRTHYVPADNEWFGDEDFNEGEHKLVPAKDPQKAMYCLTCGRFLPEEGCTCGTVTIDAVLQKLS